MNVLRLSSPAAAFAVLLTACSPSPPPPPVEMPRPTLLDTQRQALEQAKALREQAERRTADLDRAAGGGETPAR